MEYFKHRTNNLVQLNSIQLTTEYTALEARTNTMFCAGLFSYHFSVLV